MTPWLKSAQKSKRGPALVTVGAPSVLVVLVCLCLTVLSVLSLIAARNEFTLASRTVQETARYYRADADASAILAELLDEFQKSGAIPAQDGVTVTLPASQTAASGGFPAFFAEYSVPCGENSMLCCSVVVYLDGSYDILSWKKVFSAEQTFFDDSFNVWSGN
ncbi:MAG: hypothetical protein ACOYIR_06400 [Christensenellales bacterium]|jgi:hypothetical protein